MFVHCFVFSFQIPFKPSFSYVSSVLVVVSSFHHLYPHKTSYIKGNILKETKIQCKYNLTKRLPKNIHFRNSIYRRSIWLVLDSVVEFLFYFCFYVSRIFITDADDVSHSNSTAFRVERGQNEFFYIFIDYSLWNQPFLFSCCMSPFSSQWATFLKMFLILWTPITRLRRRLSFSIRRIPL